MSRTKDCLYTYIYIYTIYIYINIYKVESPHAYKQKPASIELDDGPSRIIAQVMSDLSALREPTKTGEERSVEQSSDLSDGSRREPKMS